MGLAGEMARRPPPRRHLEEPGAARRRCRNVLAAVDDAVDAAAELRPELQSLGCTHAALVKHARLRADLRVEPGSDCGLPVLWAAEVATDDQRGTLRLVDGRTGARLRSTSWHRSRPMDTANPRRASRRWLAECADLQAPLRAPLHRRVRLQWLEPAADGARDWPGKVMENVEPWPGTLSIDQLSTMALGHVLHNRQAQTCAASIARAAAVHPVKALGQTRQMLGRNALPVVLHAQYGGAIVAQQPSVLQCVFRPGCSEWRCQSDWKWRCTARPTNPQCPRREVRPIASHVVADSGCWRAHGPLAHTAPSRRPRAPNPAPTAAGYPPNGTSVNKSLTSVCMRPACWDISPR